MKIINYFGEEVEREKQPDLNHLKDLVEIYIAMHSKSDIDKILKTLTLEEAKIVCRSASTNYIIDRIKYGY